MDGESRRWIASVSESRAIALPGHADIRGYATSYRAWFESLYKDKYYYLGDKELMTAAFLMDLGIVLLRSGADAGEKGCGADFAEFPFEGPVDGAIVRKIMTFYNRRLVVLAQKKRAAGTYGAMNLDSRTLIKGFEPNGNAWKLIRQGMKIWLKAEMRSAFQRAENGASRWAWRRRRFPNMAYSSYRAFVEALEKEGELISITTPVATELEITELADREMKKPGGGKALLIEKPTVNGEVSPFPGGDQYDGFAQADGR